MYAIRSYYAKAMFAAIPGLDKDIVRFEEGMLPEDADIYFIGFGIHKGTCSMQLVITSYSIHYTKLYEEF